MKKKQRRTHTHVAMPLVEGNLIPIVLLSVESRVKMQISAEYLEGLSDIL
jgi:hypothetical protein